MIALDASAVIDVVTDQATKPWVLHALRDEDIVAPAHQLAEVVSAVARLTRAGILDARRAREALDEAGELDQELAPPSARHLRRALELQDRVRVLDGLYVALAEDRDVALVTTDRRLARAGLTIAVRSPFT